MPAMIPAQELAFVLRPNDPILFRNRAKIHAVVHEYPSALQDLERALAQLRPGDPRVVECLRERGIVRVSLGDLRGAERDFMAAIELTTDVARLRALQAMLGSVRKGIASGQ